MICEVCAECPIEKYCDMVDEIVSNQGDLEGEHDLLMAIYSKGLVDERENILNILYKLVKNYYNSNECKLMLLDLQEFLHKGAEND